MNVLIVDSNPERQSQLESLLLGLQFHPRKLHGAASISDASHLLSSRKFGCCFFALDWGAADGFMLLSEFSSSPLVGRLPLISYAVDATKENVVALIQAGATGFLVSPFTVNEVRSVLKFVPKAEVPAERAKEPK